MSVLPIFLYGQPILRKKARPVRVTDESLAKLAGDMVETMHRANGIGLAANQVGDLRRVIVVDVSEVYKDREGSEPGDDHLPPEARAPLVMVNPEIVLRKGEWTMEEGCLSIPEIREEVARAEVIHVRYRDLRLRERAVTASGLFGRVILHEVDHLNGVLFLDHLSTMKQKLLRGRLNKIRKGELEVAYPVVTESVMAE